MEVRSSLIIDDDKLSIDFLVNSLNKIGLFNIYSAFTIAEANEIIKSQKIDLIFVDILLDDVSGFDFIKSHANLPPVIITSAYPEFAVNAFDIDLVVDFIQKPYSIVRLRRAINRALDNVYGDNFLVEKDFAFFKVSRKVLRFEYTDISYIEAYGVYSKVFNSKGAFHLVNEPISVLESALPTQLFKRVHKSYIVNLKKLTGYDHKSFIIDGITIPVGMSYKASLQGLFRIFENIFTPSLRG